MSIPTFYNQTKINLSLLYREPQKDDLAQHQQDEADYSPPCELQWRQGKLLVRLSQNVKQLYLPSLETQQRLVQCLKHSPVRMVCIDTNLGEAALKHWAKACKEAKKPVFLRGTVTQKWQEKSNKLSWSIKLMDWIAAFLLLMVLSPIMLVVVVLQRHVYSQSSIFSREWRVGARGKLFQSLRFRTTEIEQDSRTTPLGYWLSQYNMDKLPQLFNILRGEMSLFGQRPANLCDAVRITPGEPRHLKTLPNNDLVVGLVA